MNEVLGARERQREILAVARESGRVDVTSAADRFGVAAETIRRDMKTLERNGLIRRSYGSAYPVVRSVFETDLASRETNHHVEKLRIAEEAARHLDEAEAVFVDEGYLPQLLAQSLPPERSLTVVTASLPVAALLAARPNYTVLLLGGLVRGRTLATVEHWATRMLAEFVIDLAYVGTNGISLAEGLTTPDPPRRRGQGSRRAFRSPQDIYRDLREVRDVEFLSFRTRQRSRNDYHRLPIFGRDGATVLGCRPRGGALLAQPDRHSDGVTVPGQLAAFPLRQMIYAVTAKPTCL